MQNQENSQPTEQAVPDELVRAIENNPEEVAVLVERLGLINDLVDVVELGMDAVDDEMVHSLAGTGSRLAEVADDASDPETVAGMKRLLRAVGDAEEAEAEPVGAVGLLRATRDPEVKAGLGYLVALAAALGARTDEE
ncbi:DUF1641 domain-containing protein [Haloferax mediterranei ATCC 33500]|uniref:DUF1641 domain-containing protein n=1 Tax=Haloferax mediterranei (strain ATCC 33500 / DSM 1411 / JCM 8866 / NBRC 14739 / NCIMB 2177 / R-4) TaxID=523841 RepID=I3R0V0_HALMT|nr:DUF1641 domain-containing protein [Haloferax mediterranei]AFK17860.1 hypothetical protein HFX_0118 [Haloferax mediterranei ATCC 33500]AHZ22718.1 hypothetical protein BM92_08685 [Haloferax mediterranei ATCC 33500]EMA02867.1 hypothetical protein C439_09800 [Haloferax mediterranei ATCC 33500]MDX5987948.1 DUF1641 domain-containing protein [Haloferax mediterranei ATCC 33500]QCQ74418.1 DUF1641 domain-containing protein [Haloferax mediterranei ATCC 33500]